VITDECPEVIDRLRWLRRLLLWRLWWRLLPWRLLLGHDPARPTASATPAA
jgi:hypothetical protein